MWREGEKVNDVKREGETDEGKTRMLRTKVTWDDGETSDGYQRCEGDGYQRCEGDVQMRGGSLFLR